MENDWILRTAVSNTTYWSSIAYGKELFVATGSSETQGKIMTSRNGINWTTNNFMIGFHYGWNAITYANGIFVAGGGGGPGGALDIFITSPDGLNWTLRQAELFSRTINGITYGNGLFVAVGNNRYIQTSPDGISWSYRNCSMDNHRRFVSVTYGNELFVAISEGYQLCTSPDGINWSLITINSNNWVSITYGNGLFVIGGLGEIITSPNGINWTIRSVGFGVSCITYAKELFVTLSYGSYAISSNGINWTLGTFPLDSYQKWNSIIYTEDIFIAVTSGYTNTYNILTNGVKLLTQIDPIFGTFSIPTKTFGENIFTITAPISTSDGLFTYTSSNTLVATIVDDIITIVGPGTSIITATQLETTNYTSGILTTIFNVNENQQSNPSYIYNVNDLLYFNSTSATYGYIINSIEVSYISLSTTKVLFTTSNFIVITGNSV